MIFHKLIEQKSLEWTNKHNKKLNSLRSQYQSNQSNSYLTSIEPIKNLSSRKLSTSEHNALIHGLDFVYRNPKFREKEFISNVETFFVSLLGRCTHKFDWEEKEMDENTMFNMTAEQLKVAAKLRSSSNRFKACTKREFRGSHKNNQETLLILKELARDRTIHVTRPDKGKGVVILDRQDYVHKMLEIINDSSTFERIDEDPTIKKENQLINTLREMKERGFLTLSEYSSCRPCGSQCAKMYGLPKIHKTGIPLRPVMSAIGSYNYKLAKMLANKIQRIRHSQYIVKDTFQFIECLKSIKPNMVQHKMVSFDVISLFIKVPLTFTIQLILDKLYGPEHNCSKIKKSKTNWCSKCRNRNDMNKLLNIATSGTHFSFNEEYYRQHDGLAMGSPLAPILADIFMTHLENKLMAHLRNAGILWYKRYVDDTFAIIDKNANINDIIKILNSFHPAIQFTSTKEENDELPFLDVLVRRANDKLETSVYRKPTYTGLLIHWTSFVPKSYKISAISSMVYRAIRISSTYTIMHKEFDFIRDIAKKNRHPSNFVECQIRHTLNRFIQKQNRSIINNHKNTLSTENKSSKDGSVDKIMIDVPFVGKPTQQFIKDISKLARKIKPTTQFIAVPRPPQAVRQFFKNKDNTPKDLQSNIIYEVKCSDCSATYIGKTRRQACRRLKEHGALIRLPIAETNQALRRSNRIASNAKFQVTYDESDYKDKEKSDTKTQLITSAIQRHIALTKHNIDWYNWKTLERDTHPYRLLVKESLTITQKAPSLNQTTRSVPLVVFPEGYIFSPTHSRKSYNSITSSYKKSKSWSYVIYSESSLIYHCPTTHFFS